MLLIITLHSIFSTLLFTSSFPFNLQNLPQPFLIFPSATVLSSFHQTAKLVEKSTLFSTLFPIALFSSYCNLDFNETIFAGYK